MATYQDADKLQQLEQERLSLQEQLETAVKNAD